MPPEKQRHMDARDSLVKVIASLIEAEKPMRRDLLVDFIIGRESQDIVSSGLDNLEQYGCGEARDEDHWNLVIDQAVEAGYLKVRSNGDISAMAKGKKYQKKPTAFMLKDEEDEEEFDGNSLDDDSLLMDGMSHPSQEQAPSQLSIARSQVNSQLTRQKLLLIQTIDRKLALDEYAEQQGISFDEVMDDLESILSSGRKMDVRYFAYEVLGEECLEELLDYYANASSDSLDLAIEEYGDVYQPEELRLARIIYRANKIK